jgi:hypothetical protein
MSSPRTSDSVDPWGELNGRYQHDEHAQFILFVEQFAEIRDLIMSGQVTKQRMALVALDNLAEVLLHRHKRLVLSFAEAGSQHRVPRLSNSDLRRLSADFGARVTLARGGSCDPLFGGLVRPILDDLDEAVFRSAHAYRNRVYHADHHNSAVLPYITKSFMGAVGRGFMRLQPTNVASSLNEWRRQQLAPYGYAGSKDSHWPGMFAPAEAAKAISEHLSRDICVGLEESKAALQDDLAWRTAWADEMIKHLLGDGFPLDRLAWALRWDEFWKAHGSDDTVVELDKELADTWTELVQAESESVELHTRINTLNASRNARISAMFACFSPNTDLAHIAHIRRLADRLVSARNVGTLFIRYQRLDEDMEKIENALDDAAIGWDRHVQEEVDRLRGK